jgi:HEAT repeat protein
MRLLASLPLLLVLCIGCRHKGPPEYQGKPLRYWEAQAASDSADRRRAAAEALGAIGPQGLPALVILRSDTDPHVWPTASLALRKMGRTAVPKLKELTYSPDAKLRAGAGKTLIEILVDMRGEGVPELIELLKGSDPGVRLAAAKAFARIDGEAPKAAVPAIREALQDEDPTVRRAAYLTLQVLTSRRPRAK